MSEVPVTVHKDDDPDYYEVELTPAQRRGLLKLLSSGSSYAVSKNTREAIQRAVTNARPMANELPPASLPWDEVRADARRQGVGEADVVWDRFYPSSRSPER